MKKHIPRVRYIQTQQSQQTSKCIGSQGRAIRLRGRRLVHTVVGGWTTLPTDLLTTVTGQQVSHKAASHEVVWLTDLTVELENSESGTALVFCPNGENET